MKLLVVRLVKEALRSTYLYHILPSQQQNNILDENEIAVENNLKSDLHSAVHPNNEITKKMNKHNQHNIEAKIIKLPPSRYLYSGAKHFPLFSQRPLLCTF